MRAPGLVVAARAAARVFEGPLVGRWTRSKSFLTRALAGSYGAEFVRPPRTSLEFGPGAGEPVLWAAPELPAVTWHEHTATRPLSGLGWHRVGDGLGWGMHSWSWPPA